jgi:hypothetical protein
MSLGKSSRQDIHEGALRHCINHNHGLLLSLGHKVLEFLKMDHHSFKSRLKHRLDFVQHLAVVFELLRLESLPVTPRA